MLDNRSNPRRALVTGGASGFGHATAAALLDRAHRVASYLWSVPVQRIRDGQVTMDGWQGIPEVSRGRAGGLGCQWR